MQNAVAEYDWVFWTRVDIEFSDTFIDDVFPTIAIKAQGLFVPFTMKKPQPWLKSLPNPADTMLFVPKSRLWIVQHPKFRMTHKIWNFVHEITGGQSFENVFVMLDTIHDSDSYKDWNPLYRIVNRT